MLHVLYTHSPITNLVVQGFLEENDYFPDDQIIIFTNRSIAFDCDRSNTCVFDLFKMFGTIQDDNNKSLRGLLRSYKSDLNIRRFMKSLLTDPFMFYTPSYSISISNILIGFSNCISYYFIEEGTLAYTDRSYLLSKYKQDKRHIIKKILGVDRGFYLEITSKFKGTISIFPEAFKWNTSNHIVSSLPHIGLQKKCETILVLSRISNVGYIKSCIKEYFRSNPAHGVSGLKFHPASVAFEKDSIDEILDFVEQENYNVEILNNDYELDLDIILNGTNIVLIQNISSAAIYSILNGNRSTLYTATENLDVHVKTLESVDDVLNTIYPDYNDEY